MSFSKGVPGKRRASNIWIEDRDPIYVEKRASLENPGSIDIIPVTSAHQRAAAVYTIEANSGDNENYRQGMYRVEKIFSQSTAIHPSPAYRCKNYYSQRNPSVQSLPLAGHSGHFSLGKTQFFLDDDFFNKM